jgi:predicted RND superfamily exporter protein
MNTKPETPGDQNIPTGRYSAKQSRTERYARWVIRYRWLVLTLVLAATGMAATGVAKLGLATDYRVFFSPDNPDLEAFEVVENVYTKNDNVLFVIRPDEGDVFQPAVLDVLRSFTEDAWQIPNSTRVDGITNFQHTWADGDELIVEDLVGSGPITEQVVERARRVATTEPLLAKRLVSEDMQTTGINVRISLPGESKDELPETMEYVRALLSEYRTGHPDLEIHASGIAVMNSAFAEAPQKDMPVVMPLMFAAFVLAIILFLRSFAGVVSTLAVLLTSMLAAIGIAGHYGVLLDPVSASAPTIILTLAVADSIHILVTWLQATRRGVGSHDAIVEAVRVNAKPVFLTSITTAIGFLSLNFSDSPPFRLLGNITALGVMIAWIYSMALLPAVIAILPVKNRVRFEQGRLDQLIDRFANVVVRQFKPILAASAIATVILSVSIGSLRINDQYIDYFDRSLPVRVASDFTVDHLSGIYTTTYSLDAGGSQEISDPEYLAAVDAFADYLESRPAVVHVNSFTRTMKRLNMNLHGDDPDQYKLPNDQELAAQYLLLYELSLPYGLDVNDQIDVDKSSLRIDVTYGDVDMSDVEAESNLASAWLAKNGTPSMREATATGVPMMFGKITRRNIASMIVGTGLGFLLIALILMVALRSVRIGVISLIPNVLPAAMAFGVWALLVHDVGFAVSVVAGLSIGIIVDDTVHFLSKYTRARREKGLSAPEAVRYAFSTVGAAIIGTTFVVAVGFAMLGLSTFRVTSYMGLMTSLTVLCALVIDFLLLPTLLLVIDRGQTEKERATLELTPRQVAPVPVKTRA